MEGLPNVIRLHQLLHHVKIASVFDIGVHHVLGVESVFVRDLHRHFAQVHVLSPFVRVGYLWLRLLLPD